MRTSINLNRILGSGLFALAAVASLITSGSTTPVLILIPALAILIDGIVRLRTKGGALPGLIIDAAAAFFALAVRGPSVTTNALVICYFIVAAALLLPMVQAISLVTFAGTLWITVNVTAHLSDTGPFGAIERAGWAATFDRVMAVVVLFAVASVMLRAIAALLNAQDKQEEALVQERRAVELKNEFVSMVSHELRTPLTGIAGFTEALIDDFDALPPDEVQEFLTIMREETDHLANLVEDILVIPRLEAGQLRLYPTPLDLAAEAQSVANMVLSGDTSYSVVIPSGVTVIADQTRLRQILRNLVENARKYGGEQVLIEGELSGPGHYTVSVSDNGPGIPETDQARIFDHFEQLSTGDARQQQGVGLGLPIARKLARAMGGDLWYENLFPVGSKFRFSLALAPSPDAPVEGTDSLEPVAIEA
jgi:signal transduction histidine kinase